MTLLLIDLDVPNSNNGSPLRTGGQIINDNMAALEGTGVNGVDQVFSSATYQPNQAQGLNDPHELSYSAALPLNSGDTVGGADLNVFSRDVNGVATLGGSPGGSYTYLGSVTLNQGRIGRFNKFVV